MNCEYLGTMCPQKQDTAKKTRERCTYHTAVMHTVNDEFRLYGNGVNFPAKSG